MTSDEVVPAHEYTEYTELDDLRPGMAQTGATIRREYSAFSAAAESSVPPSSIMQRFYEYARARITMHSSDARSSAL